MRERQSIMTVFLISYTRSALFAVMIMCMIDSVSVTR